MKSMRRYGLRIVMVLFALAVIMPAGVLAYPMDSQEGGAQTKQTRPEAAQIKTEERHAEAKTRLEAAKLRVCQNRQKNITNIMARMKDRGQKHLDLFTKIAERTQKFYTEKGKVLSNYDALVADVNTKKAAAQEAVNAVKSIGMNFDCRSDDPKGTVQAFKESQRAEAEALKAYKTAVKNLIVGVKSVQGTMSSGRTQ